MGLFGIVNILISLLPSLQTSFARDSGHDFQWLRAAVASLTSVKSLSAWHSGKPSLFLSASNWGLILSEMNFLLLIILCI